MPKIPQRNVNLASTLNLTVLSHLELIRSLVDPIQTEHLVNLGLGQVTSASLDSITAIQNYKKKTLDISQRGQRG